MKNTLFVKTTASPITTIRCTRSSLPACKYRIIVHEKIEELLHKLDTFCFTYQHVDRLYTLFKYRFSGIGSVGRSDSGFFVVGAEFSLSSSSSTVSGPAAVDASI